jgi:hypothetical protein
MGMDVRSLKPRPASRPCLKARPARADLAGLRRRPRRQCPPPTRPPPRPPPSANPHHEGMGFDMRSQTNKESEYHRRVKGGVPACVSKPASLPAYPSPRPCLRIQARVPAWVPCCLSTRRQLASSGIIRILPAPSPSSGDLAAYLTTAPFCIRPQQLLSSVSVQLQSSVSVQLQSSVSVRHEHAWVRVGDSEWLSTA